MYQDFLFESTVSITGVQVKLSAFTGSGPGLHILQLLSSGAFASAVDGDNGQSCFAPNPSNTTRMGNWVAKVADTGIAGTTQTVLVSNVDVGTSPGSGPSFTWIPYVSAAGNYDIHILIPGCTDFQDCDSRTSVKVTVFPGENIAPSVTTISQQNTDDTSALLYSGPIVPSGPNFVTTITMTLADQPEGSGSGGQYEIVADRIELVLKSASFSNSSSTPGALQGLQRGFGFFEWPRGADTISSTLDASQILPNTSLTTLDGISTQLYTALGSTNVLNNVNITAVAYHPSGTIFLGGNFQLSSGSASGASHIVMYKNGALAALAGNGLDGAVSALLVDQNRLIVGGEFSDTAANTTSGRLRSIAAYEIEQNKWSALGAGISGRVTGLSSNNGLVQAVGSFSSVDGNDVSGIAVWNSNANTWMSSGGFIMGDMSFIANGTSQQWLAGNVVAYRKFGASGITMLQNGDDDGPRVDPVQVALSRQPVAANASTPNNRRTYNSRSAQITRQSLHQVFGRQSNAALPALPPVSAPAVLAGVFWTNSTSSTEIAIFGGNFTHDMGSGIIVSGVLLYDLESNSTSGLTGPQVNGVVHTFLLDGNRLYVGGQFTIPDTNANGFAIYDLTKQQWDLDSLQPLQVSGSESVIVRSVTKSSSQPNKIVVAGTFAKAGSLTCEAVCVYDTSDSQWNAPGAGISGQVSAVAYAGVSSNVFNFTSTGRSLVYPYRVIRNISLSVDHLPLKITNSPALLNSTWPILPGRLWARVQISLVQWSLSK